MSEGMVGGEEAGEAYRTLHPARGEMAKGSLSPYGTEFPQMAILVAWTTGTPSWFFSCQAGRWSWSRAASSPVSPPPPASGDGSLPDAAFWSCVCHQGALLPLPLPPASAAPRYLPSLHCLWAGLVVMVVAVVVLVASPRVSSEALAGEVPLAS